MLTKIFKSVIASHKNFITVRLVRILSKYITFYDFQYSNFENIFHIILVLYDTSPMMLYTLRLHQPIKK